VTQFILSVLLMIAVIGGAIVWSWNTGLRDRFTSTRKR
jgi:hypothetical protein